MTADVPELLTYEQAAEILTISVRSLRRLVKAGLVPLVRLGRLVRFRPEDLRRTVDSSRVAEQPAIRTRSRTSPR